MAARYFRVKMPDDASERLDHKEIWESITDIFMERYDLNSFEVQEIEEPEDYTPITSPYWGSNEDDDDSYEPDQVDEARDNDGFQNIPVSTVRDVFPPEDKPKERGPEDVY